VTVEEAIKVAAPALTWAVAWLNLVVLPFFRKREALYKDYHNSGAIAAALSAIESRRLVEALAGMFEGVLDKQEDKRKKVNIRDLLQSTDFLPDFRRAEEAYRDIGDIERTYKSLKDTADLWRWGAAHALASALVPAACLDFDKLGAWSWVTTENLLRVLALVWGLTLIMVVRRLLQFHSLMRDFLKQLETAKGTAGGD
jgi:hypothetical protein